MKYKNYTCPCCGKDISDYVHSEIVSYNRQRNAERMRQAPRDPEDIKRNTEASQKRLAEWRKNNPQEATKAALKASAARTPETFKRQAESIKETQRRKTIRFAELMLRAKMSGVEVTIDVEKELLEQAKIQIKEELKIERRNSKKADDNSKQ